MSQFTERLRLSRASFPESMSFPFAGRGEIVHTIEKLENAFAHKAHDCYATINEVTEATTFPSPNPSPSPSKEAKLLHCCCCCRAAQQQPDAAAACHCSGSRCKQKHICVSTNDNNQIINATTAIKSNKIRLLITSMFNLYKRSRRPQQQQQQQSLQYPNFLLLPTDKAFAETPTTTRLSLSRNNYNNSKHNQQTPQQQQQQQQQQTLAINCATSQQQQHHKRRQHDPDQVRRLFQSAVITVLVFMFLATAMPVINATILPAKMDRRLNYGQPLARVLSNNNEMKLSRNETTCKSLDIRNHATSFEQLANCTIIEGFLLITLMNDAHTLNHSYPMLTEVTEFIIIYRVANLHSLSQIFPNLSVIRGNLLFDGYALIVYQNRDLQDIGLPKLKSIANGGVRIEKNIALCFVTTVDWSKIVSKNTTEDDIVIRQNRNKGECPKCPGEPKNNDILDSSIDVKDVQSCRVYQGNKRYCWNTRTCQTICPERCRNNCIDEDNCCNEACLGGCTIDERGQESCTSCRHFSTNNNTCVDHCPLGYFRYDRRCITAEMCRHIGTKFESSKELKLVPYNGQCTTRCPKDHMLENGTCVACGNKCEKTCEGGIIDSSVRAKEFHSCTKIGINEGLTISMKRGGPHIVDALDFGLSGVHTINTFLKVHLTYGLTSLSFFKSLREIRGLNLLEGRYALYVLENNDLEAIWAPNQTVNISNGSVFFHFNSKLCYDTIKTLLPMMASKPKGFNKNEVALDSNGNKGACNSEKLDVKVEIVTSNLTLVSVNNSSAKFGDPRAFIGYQYYLMRDPYGNATTQSSKPCENFWNISDPTKDTKYVFFNLKPYTQYAFYVRTMTISSERKNYQSDMQWFTTSPSRPTYVRRVKAHSNSSSQIVMSWDPPDNVFGKLVKYKVTAEIAQRDSKMEQRNYCRDPLAKTFSSDDAYLAKTATKKKPPISDVGAAAADCKCNTATSTADFDQQSVEVNRQDEIEFENTLQNFLYVRVDRKKESAAVAGTFPSVVGSASMVDMRDNSIDGLESGRGNALRRRRQALIDDDDYEDGSVLLRHIRAATDTVTDIDAENATKGNTTRMDESGEYYEVYKDEVNASETKFVFSKLRHFTLYTLTVVACRGEEGTSDTEPLCSVAIQVDSMTNKLENIDRAELLEAKLETTNTTRPIVRLYWQPPKKFNGAIVSYTILYQLQALDTIEEKKCITEEGYKNQTNGYDLPNLNEGNYSVRVRTNTLAGEGEYTDYVYVIVPPPQTSELLIFLVVLILFIIVLICFGFYVGVVRKKNTPRDLIMNPTVNPFYVSLQYVPDDWEVARERVLLLGALGQGSFGMVYEGLLKGFHNAGEDTPCAVKTVNENATDRERTNFLSEASVMKEFDTYHVVRLLGVCSRGQPALVVMELMKKGDLKSYLRAQRPNDDEVTDVYQLRIGLTPGNMQPPPFSRICQMAIEIADGMAYLAAKKFVHRDLAARNCMVADDLTVKIGDFGMTRDVYETDYYRKGTKGLLPVRWMPPESLRDGVYASSSDVFSYGVVLWEMATLASQPYQGLSNEQVLRYVIDGGVMERPENCPDLLYTLMQRCWHHRPAARPSFLDIIAYLEHLADPHFKDVSFYHSEGGQQYREKERKEKSQQVGADVYADEDAEADEDTAPLRVPKYISGYKSSMEHNSSVEPRAESPVIITEEQPHSPFSMHSAYIVSSTPDGQSKDSYNMSHNNPTIMSSAPSTSAGGTQLPPPHCVRSISQIEDDAPTYAESGMIGLLGESQGTDERGYELYDPSPNFTKLSTYEASEMDELPTSGRGGGKLSGEQHLLPRGKRTPSVMPMSSSMPDDVIGVPMSSSLQPSTTSAASSNASSNTGTSSRSLKRVMADTLRNRPGLGLLNRHLFNHKRSGSNASHKSTGSNPLSSSSNTNLTGGGSGSGGGGRSSSGQNLGTIESSGSAGSYVASPRFFKPVAAPTATATGPTSTQISDNPNYQLLDESGNSSMYATGKSKSPANSMYNLMDLCWTAGSTGPTLAATSTNPNYEVMQPPSAASENPNYVLMSEPQGNPPFGAHISDNPNYQMIGSGGYKSQPRCSASSEEESDDDIEDANVRAASELIRMERRPKHKGRTGKQQQQRSRSASQTRKADGAAATTTTHGSSAAAAAAAASNVSNILKENWLRQAATTRPPPPNGFIGREA